MAPRDAARQLLIEDGFPPKQADSWLNHPPNVAMVIHVKLIAEDWLRWGRENGYEVQSRGQGMP